MGRAQVVVTMSVADLDAVLYPPPREGLEQPHRTISGHTRHEIAQMMWWRPSPADDVINASRVTFGGERRDYPAALQHQHHVAPPHSEHDADRLIHAASSILAGVNDVNRSTGRSDSLRSMLSQTARQKVSFVHDWLHRCA